VTILQEKQELRGADGAACCFTVTLARSTVTFHDDSLLQARACPPPTSHAEDAPSHFFLVSTVCCGLPGVCGAVDHGVHRCGCAWFRV